VSPEVAAFPGDRIMGWPHRDAERETCPQSGRNLGRTVPNLLTSTV